MMDDIFAERIQAVPRSFIREILKVSLDPAVISFAGGLPNPAFFPIAALRQAADQVLSEKGVAALQYSSSEGDIGLRQLIADRYLAKKGLTVPPDRIIITNGSQQGIDLLAKVLLNPGDRVLIEEPGYLGAIQSLSLYQPRFVPVPLEVDGLDIPRLQAVCAEGQVKMLYAVPNFQNPSGLTYSEANREAVAAVAAGHRFIVVEDDPYGELRFSGQPARSFAHYLPEQTVLLGSFSKIVAPGLRLGWIVAPEWIHEKLLIAKQAADLHTSSFAQAIIGRFLHNEDLDRHIAGITAAYGRQCQALQEALARNLPEEIRFTRPQGGMFLWGTLPEGMDSMALFAEAVTEKVVFVPGDPFYTGKTGTAAFRLSFTTVDAQVMEEGAQRLARALAGYRQKLHRRSEDSLPEPRAR